MTGLLYGPPILFAAGFVGLVGSVLLVRTSAYGARTRAQAVPACWLIAAVTQAVASFGHALRGELPDTITFSAVNGLQVLALSLLWLGARQMTGHAVSCWVSLVPTAIWLTACLFPGFMESREARLALYVPLAYGLAIWTTFDLVGIYRRHKVRAAMDMAVLIAAVTLVLLALVAHSVFASGVPDGAQILFTGLPALVTALYGTTLPFLMLAVTREWDALQDSARRADQLQAGRAEVERLHSGLPAVLFLSSVTIDGDRVRIERRYRGGDTATVLGWPPEDLAGLQNLGPIADYGHVPMTAHFRTTVEIGVHGWEWRVRRKDGCWSWIRTRARRLASLPDGSVEIVGYNLNIDRERRAEARAIAAARLASLGEMAAGLAHEIRQPLQSISLAAEVAQIAVERADPAVAHERLERIIQQTQRTSDLIDRLRRFARGAEDGAPPEAVPLSAAVDGALALMRSALRDASISVEVTLCEPVPVVLSQPMLLEQVLSNLLLNARDALTARPPGAPRRIRIAAEPGAEETVRVTIADTGGGIAPEVMSRLFEPFVTTKGPDKGTGLGLSICHGLIQAMGGSIEARNEAGGAIFTITLSTAQERKAMAAQPEVPVSVRK